jgi:hypothetical protein
LAEIRDLEIVDSDNVARFPEGQNVPTINNGARALEGIIARWFADTNGTILSTGTQPNYAVATSRTIPALVDGMEVVWKAHAAFASGTATLTVNALTQKNLVRQNGAALQVGDIVQDQTVVCRYNADMDAFECLGIMGVVGDAATQAQMEAATSTSVAVTPGRQHFHPGHPKFWALVTNVLVSSYNVTSITDGGTSVTVTIGNDFSSGNWCCVATISGGLAQVGAQTAGSVVVGSYDFAGGGTNPTSYNIVGFGDL